jgi:hypothetical protein
LRIKEPTFEKFDEVPGEGHMFGKANRPSTPIDAVMSGFYGDVAE